MKEVTFRQRVVHAERYGMRYLGYVSRAHWPSAHRTLLEHIKQLGAVSDITYNADVTVDSLDKPWRAENKEKSRTLAQMTRKLGNERRNEPGWRLNVEPFVLYRFTVEVTCTRCRARLWRSEIEAATDSLHMGNLSAQIASLEKRRGRRDPCRCPGDLQGWSDDYYDHGINMIFSDRAQESIRYSTPVPSDSAGQQITEFPDRAIGLTETENFRMLLNSDDNRIPVDGQRKRLRDTVKVSPYNEQSNGLLFPFLIIEAKSNKSGFDFQAIGMQTIFAIKHLLQLQMDLRAATGKETFEPLVWFIGYAGQFWNVSICVLHSTKAGKAEFHMITVWEGNLTIDSQALQILLIIDYIFDWARDIYRPLILTQLNALSMEDSESLHPDPDIFSTIGSREPTWTENGTQKTQTPGPELQFSQSLRSNCLWELDIVPYGVIRDASVLQTRLLGLVIAEDHVEDFILSFQSEDIAKTEISVLLNTLKDSWHVTGGTVATLECQWSEESSNKPIVLGPQSDDIYLLKIAIQMFIGGEWEPVRQLTYLAISEGAMSKFVNYVTPKIAINAHMKNVSVTESKISDFIQQLREQSIVDNLTGSMAMVSVSNTTHSQGKRSRARRVLRKADWKYDSSHIVVDLVQAIYDNHKVGRREPRDQYLRFFQTRCQQTVRFSGTRLWPHLAPIQLDQNGCVLVDNISASADLPKRCLYIVQGDHDQDKAAELVKFTSERGLYYTTLQLKTNMCSEEYSIYMNRSTSPNGYWVDRGNPEEIAEWIREIEKRATEGNAGTANEVEHIVILSEDSSSEPDDPMDSD